MSIEVNLSGVQTAKSLNSPSNLQAALKTAQIEVREDDDPTAVISFTMQNAEGNFVVISMKMDQTTMLRIARETKDGDTVVAKTLAKTKGTRFEASATRKAAEYAKIRAKTETVLTGRLEGIEDKTAATIIAQQLNDGNNELATALNSVNKDTLTTEDKKELESAKQELAVSNQLLRDTSIKLGLNVNFGSSNIKSNNKDLGYSPTISLASITDRLLSFIKSELKELADSLSKADKTNEKEDAMFARKRDEKIADAKKLQRKIDGIISAMKSATSKQQLMALVDEAKQIIASAREVISSGFLPTEIKTGIESSVANIEDKIGDLNPKITFTA